MVLSKLSNTHNGSNYTNGLKEWGGMYFRSEPEIRLAQELDRLGIMFFANARGRVNPDLSPISQNNSNGRLEVDFLVFHQGKCISVEVDGNHHQENEQIFRDYTRDRLLLREKIPTVRFLAQDCFHNPSSVVKELLAMF